MMVQSLGLASGLECDLAHSLKLPGILKKLTVAPLDVMHWRKWIWRIPIPSPCYGTGVRLASLCSSSRPTVRRPITVHGIASRSPADFVRLGNWARP
jgi:hypothetical protein